MSMSLYVYFNASQAPDDLLLRLQAMQQELTGYGVRASLLQRRDQPDTWMEVYEGINNAADFSARLAHAVARHDVASGCGDRHEEWFQPLGYAPQS